MSGLETGAAIVGIAVPALHAIRLLIDDIQKINEAPEVISNITTDLQNVESILETLKAAAEDVEPKSQEFDDLVGANNVQNAVKSCGDSCDKFRAALAKWLKHSKENKVNWWDRAKLGFFAEKRVSAFIAQLNTCKETVSLALNSSTFLGSLAQYKTTQEIQKALEEQEGQTRQQGALVLRDVTQSLEVAEVGDEATIARPEAQDGESLAELRAAIDQTRRTIEEYREMSALAILKLQGHRVGLNVTNVKIGEKGKGVVGITGADGTEGQLKVDIKDVTIDGRGMIGYTKGAKLDNFFD